MSKEKKFHQFIEELNQEEKEISWKKIQEQDISETGSIQQVAFSSVKRNGVALWKKALLGCLVSIIVVGAGVFGDIKLFAKEDPPSTRYCDTSMYDAIDVQLTLKDRFEQEEKIILFLDWYEITDYYADRAYELKDSHAEIGYYEQIVDINTGSLVEINVVKKEYKLQALEIYSQMTEISSVMDVQVDWISSVNMQYAVFSYQEYNYYISLEYPMEEDSILDIVEEMLFNI